VQQAQENAKVTKWAMPVIHTPICTSFMLIGNKG
jgi:hypothetical protein